MILKNYSWNDIISSGKKIIFFGSGQVLARNLNLHNDWYLYTEYIVDNDSEKWGTLYEYEGVSKEIKSPVILEKIDTSNYIIVISGGLVVIREIYDQLQDIDNLRNVECCILKFVKVRDDEIKEQLREYPSSFRISDEAKIPKLIHYCWFGKNPIPEKNKKWMESWRKYCPDYEIVEWNESNYDVRKNRFMEQAYKEKKWGFVPDYARLDIIYNYGGIYLDTDVELIKPLDELLYQEAFAGVDDTNLVSLGLGFGAVKENNVIKDMLNLYKDADFDVNNMIAAPTFNYPFFEKMGFELTGELQYIKEMTIYPEKVLSGYNNTVGVARPTNETFTLHHYDGSWNDPEKIRKIKLAHELYRSML